MFGDSRGFFYESFNQEAFNKATGTDIQFVQDNHSRSAKGVLRGLQYQLPPFAQGKLVRVARGAWRGVRSGMWQLTFAKARQHLASGWALS